MLRTSTRTGLRLASGYASWTDDEDEAKTIVFRNCSLSPREEMVLSIRNGSATVDVTCSYGNLVRCSAANRLPVAVSCAMNSDEDTVVSSAHGLAVGDAIVFGGDGGGVEEGVTYYVTAVIDENTFKIAEEREGSAFDIDADATNTYSIAEEFMVMGTRTVEAWAAASSSSPGSGLEELIVSGVGDAFCLYLTKAAVTAPAFTVYAELRRA